MGSSNYFGKIFGSLVVGAGLYLSSGCSVLDSPDKGLEDKLNRVAKVGSHQGVYSGDTKYGYDFISTEALGRDITMGPVVSGTTLFPSSNPTDVNYSGGFFVEYSISERFSLTSEVGTETIEGKDERGWNASIGIRFSLFDRKE